MCGIRVSDMLAKGLQTRIAPITFVIKTEENP